MPSKSKRPINPCTGEEVHEEEEDDLDDSEFEDSPELMEDEEDGD